MEFVASGHLGGFLKTGPDFPKGDPASFVPTVWDWLIQRFRPRLVLDVGCGEGHAVKHFLEKGVSAIGVDGCIEARDSKIIDPAHFIIHDFTKGPLSLSCVSSLPDLVWSCEFVEHVDECASGNFLCTFAAANVVAMTHAEPGQGGYHHVNERDSDYWVDRMTSLGFVTDTVLIEQSRALAPNSHWSRSGLIFYRKSRRWTR